MATAYDHQNRPTSLGANSGAETYVNNASYFSNGSLSQLSLGATAAPVATQTTTLDSVRQLPTSITVTTSAATPLTLNYWYCPGQGSSCSTNNGNLESAGIKTSESLNVAQTYQNDGLNRLTSAVETGGTSEWTQGYTYDQWGNRMVNGGSYIPNPYATPTALTQYANNQWLGSGVSYDAAGNQTALPLRTFTYDAENRLIASTQPNSMPTIGYAYDGEGRRVQKTVGTATTVYVYDAMGQLAAEVGPAVTGTPPTAYLISDTLGSTRLVLDSTGAVTERMDYLPFGEEIPQTVGGRSSIYSKGSYPSGTPDFESPKFTGKERDAETGLDYFGARYFSASQGRFSSSDAEVIPKDLSSPQGWNKYVYTLNNPLRDVDPDGRASLPAVIVQQVLQKYAPAAAKQANNTLNITLRVLSTERSLGLIPPVVLGGAATSAAEMAQANSVARMTGNDVVMAENPSNQGFNALQIVGSLYSPEGAIPTELKALASANPMAILSETSRTIAAASGVTLPDGSKLSGVEIYISAPNMDATSVSNFANNGPLPRMVGSGPVDKVTVTTPSGTVTIVKGNVSAVLK